MTEFLIILSGAVILDVTLGEPPGLFHPVVWMGNFIAFLWSKRPAGNFRLFLYGLFIVITGSFISGLAGWTVVNLLPRYWSIALQVWLLKSTFSIAALARAGGEIKDTLKRGDLIKARGLTAWHLVSRDTSCLSSEEISGAVIESLSENYTDGFIAPLLAYLVLGLPGALIYRFINTCDSMLGYRNGDYEFGGKFAALLDDLINWIPARISALVLIVASSITGLNWRNGMLVALRQHSRTESPNAGWTMAVAAGAIGVTLGKRGVYLLEGGSTAPDYNHIGLMIKVLLWSDALALCGISILRCVMRW